MSAGNTTEMGSTLRILPSQRIILCTSTIPQVNCAMSKVIESNYNSFCFSSCREHISDFWPFTTHILKLYILSSVPWKTQPSLFNSYFFWCSKQWRCTKAVKVTIYQHTYWHSQYFHCYLKYVIKKSYLLSEHIVS